MDPLDFARVCLDPKRLAALGMAARGRLSAAELSEALHVERRDALVIVGDLRAAGLVGADGRLEREMLKSIARGLPAPEGPAEHILEGDWAEDELRVFHTFFTGERLTEIPATRAKRRVVLERIAQDFVPGERYNEAEVSRRLEAFHPDYAALRRYLVDEGILSRSEGVYWRSGGRFPVEPVEEPKNAAPRPRVSLATGRVDVKLVTHDGFAAADLAAAANDVRIPRFMTDAFPHPYLVDDAERWMASIGSDDPPHHLAVVVDDVLAGGVGGEQRRDITAGGAEIGWWLNPTFWGTGVAHVAVARFIAYSFEELGLRRLEAGIFLPNIASARVAEKAGMTLEGISRAAYVKGGGVFDRLNYAITVDEWRAAQAGGS